MRFVVFMLALTIAPWTAAAQDAQDATQFEYTALPDASSWQVEIVAPELQIKPEQQEIQHPTLPKIVYVRFPLPEFAENTGVVPMVSPGYRGTFGYGMDTAGCVPEALLRQNAIVNYGYIISGGQYASYQRTEQIDDVLLYDPRDYGYLICYQGTYLDITFPSATTMSVRKLPAPDLSKVPNCGPDDDWRARFDP